MGTQRSDRGHYDAVVIGSGFGGAVAAYHLVRDTRLRVLLLERGLPYPPGSFPRTPRAMRTNFWDPSAGLHGLFELWSLRRVKAMVASGLGGGSLIYANVMLRKPPETFGPDPANGSIPWPVGYGDLADEYEDAEAVMAPSTLPGEYLGDADPDSRVVKTDAFRAAAGAAGLIGELAPLAITFRDPDGDGAAVPGVPFGAGNLHGRPRHTCTLVGECDLGCNQGAKNSLDYTYLGRFLEAGGDRARIFTCCEATALEPARGGYRVRYVEHAGARELVRRRRRFYEGGAELLDPDTDQAGDDWTHSVTAGVVVVAAGTFGSTRLLLGSRAHLPGLSGQLGRRFSTNGDLLTFARDCRDRSGEGWRDLEPSLGPVITAYAAAEIDGQRLWMEDAGGPALSEWAWQSGEMARDLWSARDLVPSLLLGRRGGRISRLVARTFGSAASSSAMLPMLTMGQDVSGGRFRLEGDGLALDWDPDGPSRGYFEAAQALSGRMARELGGRLGPPLWARLARGLTAHPLGGCPMGADPGTGVVDDRGEAFGHPGLFVADGSIMPGPVGPNPSLTIAALAGRIGKAARDVAIARAQG
ncbi:MAG TPA: GMC oxidoreductase [Solirubrobacteraceae bacterium]|nr:GMC oxidoreductase [Solirubrobacteraceae bacterium]